MRYAGELSGHDLPVTAGVKNKYKYFKKNIKTAVEKKVKLNRRQAIRAMCLDCSGGCREEVKKCAFIDWPFWPFRSGIGEQNPGEREKAIRARHLWCVGGQRLEVRFCPASDCSLYSFRISNLKANKRHLAPTKQAKKSSEGYHIREVMHA